MPTAVADLPAADRQRLTPRQREVLAAIVVFTGQHGYPPSTRDLGEMLDISSPNGVVVNLKALAAKGWIQWSVRKKGKKAKARGIVVPELAAAIERAADEYMKRLAVEAD